MSKAVRKQLLQKIELLEKGTKKSEELIVETRINDCIGMLMDCQDLAIAIGTYIEKLYGIGRLLRKTVCSCGAGTTGRNDWRLRRCVRREYAWDKGCF